MTPELDETAQELISNAKTKHIECIDFENLRGFVALTDAVFIVGITGEDGNLAAVREHDFIDLPPGEAFTVEYGKINVQFWRDAETD